VKNDERGLKLNCNLCGENHETAKCPELKNMLKMVGNLFARQYPHAATVVTAAKERIEAMEAVVEKMPMTKDGARVVPTFDTVYHPEWDTCYLPLEVWGAEHHLFEETLGLAELPPDIDPADIDFIAVGFYYEDDTGASDEGIYLVSDCYSTSEAAAIAKAKGE